MTLGECRTCAYWLGGDGATWCKHGQCYTEPEHYTHCYTSKKERFDKRQTTIQFEI